MILFPNAKINLGLDIIRRRPDGYHDICTAMYPVPLCDILEIVPARGTSTTLTVSGRHVDCPPENNLVMKAYNIMNRFMPGMPAADIYLRKIIPDGAGLGGGSADAAFTLRGLNELFNLCLSDDRLAEMAAGIGADCPFFIYNRPMLCTGTGTELTPIEIPGLAGMTIAIIKPPVSVPTRTAYAGVAPAEPSVPLTSALTSFPAAHTINRVTNAFETSVFKSYPEVAEIKTVLLESDALPRPVYASMSGSGSAVFALYDRETTDADKLSAILGNHFTDCYVFASQLP